MNSMNWPYSSGLMWPSTVAASISMLTRGAAGCCGSTAATAKSAQRIALTEFLLANNALTLANDDEMVRWDVRDLLRRAVWPADGEIGAGRRAESEMQAAVISRVKTRLRRDLLRLRAIAVANGDACANRVAV